jgi:DNA-binding NtrC family response regulator
MRQGGSLEAMGVRRAIHEIEEVGGRVKSKTRREFDVDIVPLAEMERQAILQALLQVGGDKSEAARRLGIGKSTLYRKLKRYGLAQ